VNQNRQGIPTGNYLWQGGAVILALAGASFFAGLPTLLGVSVALLLGYWMGYWMGRASVVGPSARPAEETRPRTEQAPTLEPVAVSSLESIPIWEFSQWSQSFGGQFDRSRDSVSRVKGLVQSAVGELAASFAGMNRLIQTQQASLQSLLSNMGGEASLSSDISIEQISREVSATARALDGFARLVMQVSKLNMDVYFQVEDMAEELGRIASLVNGVEWVARQTTLLALNASIEAAHVGEAGKGFQVVAGEIRSLAERSKQISRDIRQCTESAQCLVQLAQEGARSSASQDLSVLLQSKTRLDAIRIQMGGANERIISRMDEVSVISSHIREHTGAAVRSLQFEDISRQILEHVDEDLLALSSTLRDLGEGGPQLMERSEELLASRRSGIAHLPEQDQLCAGEIELF
jgi:methyl-accepting chemotaxis protein